MFNQITASLWGDEGFSAILSMKPLPEIISIISRDTSPPLWNIFEYLAFRLFGTGEVVIRTLAFIFFLGTVFFVYKIGSFLWSKKTGLLAAAFTFLNPFFFVYAFEGRMYSILALGVTASMYFFLKIIKSEKKAKTADKVGYIAATLWAMYSHHFAIFALFIQGLWFAYEFVLGKRKNAVQVFKSWIFVGIGYLPWVYPLYTQTKMVGGGFWLQTPSLKDLRNLIYDYLSEGIKTHPYILFGKTLHQLTLWLVLLTYVLRRWFKNFKDSLFLLSWFLGPIVLTWGVSQVFQSIFFNRYLLYSIPPAMLLLASQKRKISNILLIGIAASFVLIDGFYFTHPTKLAFRDLATYVKQTQEQGDFIINWYSNGTHHIWETKYYGIGGPIYVPGEGNLPFFVGTALMEKGDVIDKLPQNIGRVGVVTSGPVEEIALPGYTKEEQRAFGSLKFVWYAPASNRVRE